MFIAKGNYVLRDNSTHCTCHGPERFVDAVMIAALLNLHVAERLPHPAVQMSPVECVDECGEPVG